MGGPTFSFVSECSRTKSVELLSSNWRGKEYAVRSSFQLREMVRPMENGQ